MGRRGTLVVPGEVGRVIDRCPSDPTSGSLRSQALQSLGEMPSTASVECLSSWEGLADILSS